MKPWPKINVLLHFASVCLNAQRGNISSLQSIWHPNFESDQYLWSQAVVHKSEVNECSLQEFTPLLDPVRHLTHSSLTMQGTTLRKG